VIGRPILWLADRQFGDLHVPRLPAGREGDHFLLRLRRGPTFTPDPSVPTRVTHDEHGREVVDEAGTLGKGKAALVVRRVTLRRKDAAGKDDDVVLVTDLLDRKRFDPLDLLKLYRRRRGVEQMFQQVTETFSLSHLIGCTPRAILFQFAFCLLMYNLVQVVKAYVAEDGGVGRESVSTANLFYDVKRELLTWSYFALDATAAARGAPDTRPRLPELLKGRWDPLAYTKAADTKPRPHRPAAPLRLHGGHTSVQRLLDGTAKITPQ
jgi:Transposase DDE domain